MSRPQAGARLTFVPGARESAADEKLVRECRRRGWGLLRLVPTRKGTPDRLLLLPGGRSVFVELKRERGGVLSEIQKHRHRELRALGFEVHTPHGSPEVATMCDELVP